MELVLTLKASQSSELENQRQEDYEFETSLDYIASSKLGWVLKGDSVCLSLSVLFSISISLILTVSHSLSLSPGLCLSVSLGLCLFLHRYKQTHNPLLHNV